MAFPIGSSAWKNAALYQNGSTSIEKPANAT
jgi:hypothetical protein